MKPGCLWAKVAGEFLPLRTGAGAAEGPRSSPGSGARGPCILEKAPGSSLRLRRRPGREVLSVHASVDILSQTPTWARSGVEGDSYTKSTAPVPLFPSPGRQKDRYRHTYTHYGLATYTRTSDLKQRG